MGLFDWGKKSSAKTKDEKKAALAKPAQGSFTVPADTKSKSSIPAETKKPSMKELYGEKEIGAGKVKSGKDEPESGTAKNRKIRKYGNAHRVIIKPLITEKAANLGALNKYAFMVAPKTNKIEISQAIDELYGIKPVNINIVNVTGKKVRHGKRQGKRKDWKKAVVTLPPGKSINIYEGV